MIKPSLDRWLLKSFLINMSLAVSVFFNFFSNKKLLFCIF